MTKQTYNCSNLENGMLFNVNTKMSNIFNLFIWNNCQKQVLLEQNCIVLLLIWITKHSRSNFSGFRAIYHMIFNHDAKLNTSCLPPHRIHEKLLDRIFVWYVEFETMLMLFKYFSMFITINKCINLVTWDVIFCNQNPMFV